jgi:hypothetical protein
MPDETLVMDAGTQRQLLWISGYLPLPLGARSSARYAVMGAVLRRL